MFGLLMSNRKRSSREQIAIRQVRDSILELPNGRYRTILEVTPVNFELKSEEEQDAVIDTYESFLNSVGYPLQILIRTREIDMDKYLEGVSARLQDEQEDIYRRQIENYDEFIRSLIRNNKILTRHFYIIIPYSASRKEDFETVKEHLTLAADIVSKGVTRLGIQARLLTSLEILDLFYSFYSPEQSKVQPLTEQALHLMHEALVVRSDKPTNEKIVPAPASKVVAPAIPETSTRARAKPKVSRQQSVLKKAKPKSKDWIEGRLLEIFDEEDENVPA